MSASADALVLSRTTSVVRPRGGTKDLGVWEQQVIDALSTAKGRGKAGLTEEQQDQLNRAVQVLEQAGGVPDPTTDAGLEGKWKLLFTSRPGTASPIQNTFTGVDAFSVYQEILLQDEQPRVNNIVEFGTWGCLKVEALASTDSQPLAGFTPRESEDFLWGLFGRSFNYRPPRDNMRIDFQFDRAAFRFPALPFGIPYPVPFRLLKDEAKGWIDVTYMSPDRTFRLSRGNKGTLFVLVKDLSLKEQLLYAARKGDDEKVLELIEAMAATNPTPKPAKSPLAAGCWRLVWSQQANNASWLQKFGSKQDNSFQIVNADEGAVRNRVDLNPLLRISLRGQCEAGSDTRTNVWVQNSGFVLGEGAWDRPIFIPLPTPRNSNGEPTGWVEWLYLDKDIRITRGNKGSLFIHTRDSDDVSEATLS